MWSLSLRFLIFRKGLSLKKESCPVPLSFRLWSFHYALHINPQSIYTQSGNGWFLAYVPSWWKNQPWLVGWGVHAHPLSTYLPLRTKLQCTLQLSGQIHSPYFISTICVLCVSIQPRGYWVFVQALLKTGFSQTFSVKNLGFTEFQLVCDWICKPFKEPRNRFPALRNRFLGIDSWAP